MDERKTRTFGEELRRMRRSAGRSLTEVANYLGISAVYVSDVERGNRHPFRPEWIAKIALFLDGDAEALSRKAAEQRGAIEIRTELLSEAAKSFLLEVSEGVRYTDVFWDAVVKLSRRKGSKKLL